MKDLETVLLDSVEFLMCYRPVLVVQSLICVPLFATPWTVAHQASLSFTVSQSLLKLMSIESVMPSIALTVQTFVGKVISAF